MATNHHLQRTAEEIAAAERRFHYRAVMFHEQGGICYYCGKMMILPETGYHKHQRNDIATFDHKIAQAHGGTDDPENCICACRHCNSERGSIPHDSFLHLRHIGVAWFLFVNAYQQAIRAAGRPEPDFVDLTEAMKPRPGIKDEQHLRAIVKNERNRRRKWLRKRNGSIIGFMKKTRAYVYV